MLKPCSEAVFWSANYVTSPCLLRFLMQRMLLAELAILAEFQPVRIVLLILVGLVVAALAFRAGQRNRVSHVSFAPLA